MTRVVNLRHEPADIVIDRRSRYGNPYRMFHEGEREKVIDLYRRYIRNKLEREPDFLEPLRGKTLGCWCAPKPCHGDVILEFLGEAA